MSLVDDASHSSPGPPIKRAAVVYGKRSNALPSLAAASPLEEQQLSYERGCVRPCHTPPQSSPSPSAHPSDRERSHSPDPVNYFQFGFRHRLKELDEEFDNRDPSPSNESVPAGSSQARDLQSVTMGTATPPSNHAFEEPSPSPSAPLPLSVPSISAREQSPESPFVRRRVRRASNLVPSDSEAEEPSKSSSVSPVHHVITTPHSRSSPTPPTSGEVPMMSKKAKGKAPVRDVLPLVFDGERPSSADVPIKSKKERRSEPLSRPKTKAPTKKERREAAFESSRIAASRPVEVIRTQEQKHSLSAFFASLRRDNVVAPTLGTELPSDPIEKFSSPTDNSTRAPPVSSMFGAPTGLLWASADVGANNPSSSKRSETLPLARDSDDEMPLVTSVIQQASEKRQRLQSIKQAALQHAGIVETFDIDNEEDELLIVKDDMHTVAREEAVQRRLAHGSPVKDITTLRRINHPSARPAVISPHKLSRQGLQELAKPSFARAGKGSKSQITKEQLDKYMIGEHTKDQLKSIRYREDEWMKRGGRLSRNTIDDPQTSLSQRLGAYAELGLKAGETRGPVGDEAYTNSDDDYSPVPANADEDCCRPDDNTETLQVPQAQAVEEDEEEVVAPLRRNRSGQRHPRIIVESDDEGEPAVQSKPSSLQRDSTSSMEPQTEDENDKENSAKLMYDRSEDKENKVVVRHALSLTETTSGSRLETLIEGSIGRSLSQSSVAGFNDVTPSPPKGDVRSPLKDISKDEDDLFLSPPVNPSFTERLLRSAATSLPRPSTRTLSLASPPVLRSGQSGQINRLSWDSENDESDLSGFKPLQPSFLERLHNQLSPEPSLAVINPLLGGGFSQLFCTEGPESSTRPVIGTENNGLSLTLDVGLRPALEVSETLRQKAEIIFEREQEYVVAAAVQPDDKPKELVYVNDHGFLTQTRPEGSSPQVYHMTPSQRSKFLGTQVHITQTQPLSARPPLRTLSFTTPQELSMKPQSLRRLRKRSLSPLQHKSHGQNSSLATTLSAFDVLGKHPKLPPEARREKLGKSEFVAVEAEESDEDDMFGFGGPKKEDEDEDEDDQDKIVEGLVDDTAMDAQTEAKELVLEKHREHEEEDDQRLQKLHQDAIEGKFRMKRNRDHGVGFEDDSDEDDDEDSRRIRQQIHKKRKIEGDGLEALGQNEETRAFYNTYHQDLIDEDDEFGHLREDTVMPVDDDIPPEESEQQESISTDEIRQRVREMAQNNLEVEVLDPEDTSWIDQSMMVEPDETIHMKVVNYRRSKPIARHPNVGQDFDVERPQRHVVNEQERKQMMSWAKNQSHRYQGTGRSGNSTAITGHVKVKTGGGSLRLMQSSNPTTASETRRAKTSTLLSTVSNRRGKFA